VSNCLHGIDFPSAFLNHGNQAFYDCDLTGNTLSGVHASPGNFLDYCTFQNCHFGISPFSVMRDGAATTGFIHNTLFLNCPHELVGNSAFADLSSGGQPSWLYNRVDGTGWSPEISYQVGGLPHAFAVNLPGNCVGGYIRQDLYPFGAPPGGSGAFSFGGVGPQLL
jgi:hypothetical protein